MFYPRCASWKSWSSRTSAPRWTGSAFSSQPRSSSIALSPWQSFRSAAGRILGTAAARILAQHDVEGSLVLQLQVLHAGTLASQGLLCLSALPGNVACRVHVEVLAQHVELGVNCRRSFIVVALFGFGQQLFEQLLLHIFAQDGFIDTLELENGRPAGTVHAC